jgi:hypothetical protein
MTKRHDLQQLKEKASIEFDGFSFGSVRIVGLQWQRRVNRQKKRSKIDLESV